MLIASWGGLLALRRGAPKRRTLWLLSGLTFSGWIATLAGWLVTEIGRQPWLVTGILRTADAAGAASAAELRTSLAAYAVCYGVMLLAYIVVVTHLAGAGAQPAART
jgi:cytochrome d ubiquinol oxidase subunit I